ncbi:MBL fold metallo-hydrolase [Romeria aff. gracilis LEGE 07310]|uniref:MBL fold metallo-hydrolase n=1 Tax=Vasconcelosia minhoensis LEGE 07310 TaxID=915328 RepID=A0A8J7DCA5_9CYAN|nr:MBL fold metallo-hydrolase [Romeria gracilis]MBE9078697.1 MBL fold metallo-hydrolase [Romeria aff. gracilis LEGE 07310]
MTELSCFPYAVGHSDEGVCLGIQIGPYYGLLDCGLADIALLRQARRADFAFCSHAHTDHAQGLRSLSEAFPGLPVYGSEVTARLLPLNWPNHPTSRFCRGLPWRTPIELAQGLTAQIWPAGHLPGAACLLLTYTTPQRTYSIFYTGDCFLSNGRLVEGLPLTELRGLRPDVLIVDGTYGTARHPHRRQQENQLAERVNKSLDSGTCVVFPAPVLGLGQELLMLTRSHHHFTGQPIDIWVDATIAGGCDAYLELLPYFPSAVQNFAQHQALFWDERVLPLARRLPTEAPLTVEQPAIFITHPTTHPAHYCHSYDGEWTVFLPYDSDLSLWQAQPVDERIELVGYDWLDALKTTTASGTVQVESYTMTNHCDGVGTTQLIHNLRPQHVIFTHGAADKLAELASLEELQSRYQLHLSTAHQPIELPLAESFWQPEPLRETAYEGEVEAAAHELMMRLPPHLAKDPRWVQLSDTGIIEARWQGDQLVIRGLNQQELLQSSARQATSVAHTCYYCRHLRGQRCRNSASPLFGLKVTPEGSCPVFERARQGPEFELS